MNKPTSTEQKLRDAVELMDSFSQGGFEEISAIATLALIALETPAGHQNIESIARALMAIKSKAQDIQNIINCEAGNVGCASVDTAWEFRADAHRQATLTKTGGSHV